MSEFSQNNYDLYSITYKIMYKMKVAIPQEKVGSSYKSREPPREKAVNTKTNFLNCFTTTFKYFLNSL